MNHVIMANHMISLITSSTTDPRCPPEVFRFPEAVSRTRFHWSFCYICL